MSLNRDFTNVLHDVQLLAPSTKTSAAEQTTSAIDAGYCRDGLLLINLGAMGAGATLGVQIQTCDTSDGTFADVMSADGAITDADASTLICYALLDLKRYVKFQYNVSVDNVLFGALLVAGHRVENPPS